jgi:hypothetical protein
MSFEQLNRKNRLLFLEKTVIKQRGVVPKGQPLFFKL